MHDKGYTHRDIKPENCMLQRSNHLLKLVNDLSQSQVSLEQRLGTALQTAGNSPLIPSLSLPLLKSNLL
jgi:serine/threonine protein kinase